jgi:hypothetical protein
MARSAVGYSEPEGNGREGTGLTARHPDDDTDGTTEHE